MEIEMKMNRRGEEGDVRIRVKEITNYLLIK